MTRTVEIIEAGRAGLIRYRDGSGSHDFYWEFGGGRVVGIVFVPSPADWDAELPWAAGRRMDVLAWMAAEVCRQKCPRCGIEIGDRWVELLEPEPARGGIVDGLLRAWRRFTGG